MSKKETTLGEEFENLMSFVIKYKVNMKEERKRIKQTTSKVRKELEQLAKKMELPIENPKVFIKWGENGGFYNDIIFVELIGPLYFPAPKYKIVWNEEFKQHIAIVNHL